MNELQNRILNEAFKQLPELNLEPGHFGVDVAEGIVDGEKIGIMSALVCAIARHEISQELHSPGNSKYSTNIKTHSGIMHEG